MAALSVPEVREGGEGARTACKAPVQGRVGPVSQPRSHSQIQRDVVTRFRASWNWGASQDLPQRAKGGFLHPQIPGAKLPAGMARPLPTPSGYTVTYSLNVTVRQFAVTSVIIIFPKKGLNSLRGSSGSSWASAGGFSAAVGAAATAAAVAGTSGFT